MSHVKNADAYSRLVGICTGYGGNYNPGRQTLQLSAMRALLKEAQSSLQDVSTKTNAYKEVSNEREIAFAGIGSLSSRIVLALMTSEVPRQTVDDARYFVRLINGRTLAERAPVPSDDAEEEQTRTRRFTQQSYVAIAANFGELVKMVSTVGQYLPTHPDLEVPVLQAKAKTLSDAVEAVNKARIARSNAMLKRNQVMYRDANALVNNAKMVKVYVRSVFGPRSVEARQVGELSFTKPKVR